MEGRELIAAIVALAAVLGWILKTLFARALDEKREITTAYLEHVKESTQTLRELSNGLRELCTELREHDDMSRRDHVEILHKLNNPKRRASGDERNSTES